MIDIEYDWYEYDIGIYCHAHVYDHVIMFMIDIDHHVTTWRV